MGNVAPDTIRTFLEALGNRYAEPATLYLLGGSALSMLGNPRPTLDIDYVGSDREPNELQRTIARLADEMQIEVEPVPIEEFVPLPPAAKDRSVFVRQFGALAVYVFDPYTIALSKLDRGLDTDIEDVVFLLKRGYIQLQPLEEIVAVALGHAHEFDLDPAAVRTHLEAVRDQL